MWLPQVVWRERQEPQARMIRAASPERERLPERVSLPEQGWPQVPGWS